MTAIERPDELAAARKAKADRLLRGAVHVILPVIVKPCGA
jgi:hypothetical protein